MRKKVLLIFLLSFAIITFNYIVKADETPARNANAHEIYAFCRDNIYREENGELDFVEDVLLEIPDLTLREWRTTLQREADHLETMIDDQVDVMGNHASPAQVEGFRLQLESYEQLILFVEEAINLNTPETSDDDDVQGDVDAFIEATNASQQYANEHFANYESRDYGDFDDVLDNIGNYIPTEEDVPSEIVDMGNIVLTVITNIGMVLSILVLAILGIKYMVGSLEERANYKKDLIPYLIGAGLLFGITTIVKILQQLSQNINNI